MRMSNKPKSKQNRRFPSSFLPKSRSASVFQPRSQLRLSSLQKFIQKLSLTSISEGAVLVFRKDASYPLVDLSGGSTTIKKR